VWPGRTGRRGQPVDEQPLASPPRQTADDTVPGAAPLKSAAPETPPDRKWLILECLFGFSWWRPSLVAALATVTGLAEAALLAIVAQVAAVLATNHNTVDAHFGVISVHASVRDLLIAAAVLASARLILLVPASSLAARITADAQATMRENLLRAFLFASWAVKSRDREGNFQELMTNQVTQATWGVIQAVYLLTSLFSFVVLVASALVLSPRAAAIVVVACVLVFAVLRPLSRAGQRASQAHSAALLDQADGVSEAARLAEETQVFGVTSAQEARLQQLIERTRELFFRTQFSVRLVPSLYQSAVYLLLCGGLAIIYGIDRSGLASLGGAILLLIRAGTYGNQAQNSYQVMRQATPFIERLQLATQLYDEAAFRAGAERFEALDVLSFRNVSYSYDDRAPVLSDVTFEVSAGEAIGIIGPSGAGKSTLAQLLLRLRQPDAGDYLVNGVPAHSLRWSDWTKLVAYVPQTPQLIHGSVADNIRYFRHVQQDEVGRAARLAGIHDDILTWSRGYDTIVGPRTAAVSVGQAQRICLARALALRPQILVLDEPTSSLDPDSERLIQASLTALRGTVTLLIIAHGQSTLAICDRLVAIVDGKLDDEVLDFDSRHRAKHSAS
jgi:ABC-type multidrug transport system fused ATPase/permease subunit